MLKNRFKRIGLTININLIEIDVETHIMKSSLSISGCNNKSFEEKDIIKLIDLYLDCKKTPITKDSLLSLLIYKESKGGKIDKNVSFVIKKALEEIKPIT